MELNNEFNDIADERRRGILAAGQTVSWEDTKAYLAAKARGESPGKSVARNVKH